jgi:hypothetical protein
MAEDKKQIGLFEILDFKQNKNSVNVLKNLPFLLARLSIINTFPSVNFTSYSYLNFSILSVVHVSMYCVGCTICLFTCKYVCTPISLYRSHFTVDFLEIFLSPCSGF